MAKDESDKLQGFVEAVKRRSAADVYDVAYSMPIAELVGVLKVLSPAEFAFTMRAVSELRLQVVDRFSNGELAQFARQATAAEIASVLAGTGWRTAAVMRELDYEVLSEKVMQADVASAVFILRHSGDSKNRLSDRMLSSISPREIMSLAKNACLNDLVFLLEHGGDSAHSLLKHLSPKDLEVKIHGAGAHQAAFLIRHLGKKGERLLDGLELSEVIGIVRDSSATDFLTIMNVFRPRRTQILNKLTDSELSRIAAGADAEELTEIMALMGERKSG